LLSRSIAAAAADNIVNDRPAEMGLKSAADDSSVEVAEEGEESDKVKDALGLKSANPGYVVQNPLAPTKTPRLFYMSSIATAGQRFEVTEVLCPYRSIEVINSMPFRQTDIYIDEQPGTSFILICADLRANVAFDFFSSLLP
jgi:hypothetical protein